MPAILRALLATVLVAGFAGSAWADKLDNLAKQLGVANEYKERVAAAAALGKLGDKRAVTPLIKALSDKDRNVRATAATALPLVLKKASKADKARAIAALEEAKDDGNAAVRDAVAKALDQLVAPSTVVPTGGTYVEIGAMAAKAPEGKSVVADMRKTAVTTMTKKAPQFTTQWPGGKSPSKSDLAGKKLTGYYVDGSISEMAVAKKGGFSVVSCKIDMVIATFPERSMFGFIKGSASVETDPKEIEDAKKDCVNAVVEDLIETKVIPTLRTRS